MAEPLSINRAASDGPARSPESDAALMRLVRLVVAAVEAAGADGLRLTSRSAVYTLAQALAREASDEAGLARTSMMVLRDLVWRVDTARTLLAQRSTSRERQELDLLFDTSDVHAFLDQARRDADEAEKTLLQVRLRG